jgi:hypothetical protein
MNRSKPNPSALRERMSRTLGGRIADRWWTLSESVARAALGSDPAEAVPALRRAADDDTESPVSPAFRLWAADSLARACRDEEAVALYDKCIAIAGAERFENIDFAGEALRHQAGALARLGDVDGAIKTYRDLATHGEKQRALYRAGLIAERSGRRKEAINLYREVAAPTRTHDTADRGQAALRAAERLEDEGRSFSPSPLGAARRLEAALGARDSAALRSLSSPTHFQIGPGGGHFCFENAEMLDRLCADLKRSRPHRMGHGLLGTGRKRYLMTRGWRGRWFRGTVGFCLTQSSRGWEWSGVVVGTPTEAWLAHWAPVEKETNQPLPFGLLAPWPEGRYFKAGGLPEFAGKSAVLLGSLLFAGAIAYGYSRSNCGFGLRGFYYNETKTHSGSNAFAIDFTAYRKGVPFDNVAGGTPVLSPADATVRTVPERDIESGDSLDTNEVQLGHEDPATGTVGFVSRYLHLAGPGMVPVSAGEPAPRGRRLGLMNDTGNSVLDHLHFSIHRITAAGEIGPSVRPSPMEGRTLGDDDSGACIRSTNAETLFIRLPPGCVTAFGDIVRAAFGRGP